MTAVNPSRIAGAPISWGVCEVPGWGRQLAPDRVLGEMTSLGLTATELGPVGYLPLDAARLRAQLDRHGLRLVGGFVPVVLHEPTLDRTLAEQMAGLMSVAGAELFVGAIVMDRDWSPPRPLDDDEWARLVKHLHEIDALVAAYGLELALHPHVGTLIETHEQVERLMADADVGWCLDTGHLLIGGTDPAQFAQEHGDRVSHVHLKDVDAAVARRLRAGELTLVQAVQQGLFRPLGQGDAGIDAVLRELDGAGYERWLVLEQDTAITGEEPPVGRGPVEAVKASIDHLTALAPRKQEEVGS